MIHTPKLADCPWRDVPFLHRQGKFALGVINVLLTDAEPDRLRRPICNIRRERDSKCVTVGRRTSRSCQWSKSLALVRTPL